MSGQKFEPKQQHEQKEQLLKNDEQAKKSMLRFIPEDFEPLAATVGAGVVLTVALIIADKVDPDKTQKFIHEAVFGNQNFEIWQLGVVMIAALVAISLGYAAYQRKDELTELVSCRPSSPT